MSNLYDTLAAHFPADRTRPCLILPDERVWTYGDLMHASARMAHALVRFGARPGNRIAVQVEKSPEAFVLYLAALRAGLVYLPLNPAYPAAEVAYFLEDAEPAVFVSGVLPPDVAAHLLPNGQVLTLDANGQGSLIAAAAGERDHFATVPRYADDLAAILYTSGTTGRSKGAMLTHGNLRANAETLAQYWQFSADDVLLHMLPLFHIHGLFVAGHCVLMRGAAMFFEPRFDVARALQRLPESSVMMGVPTFYTRLLSDPGFNAASCARIRLLVSGSAPLLPETFEAVAARTRQRILERYGMTEGGMFTSNPYQGERRCGSVGPALPGVQVRVVDDNGATCAVGTPGHIQVRGPNVFCGYWRQPEKTRAEFTMDGFFKTGDIGHLDAEGYLTISGRARDLIITGGLNVYPKEVEDVINRLPGVAESAVIGLPHPDFGEAVTAVVIAAADVPLDEAAVVAHTRGLLAAFKTPKRVIVTDQLPRNTMGKVMKNVLRQDYAALYAPQVAAKRK